MAMLSRFTTPRLAALSLRSKVALASAAPLISVVLLGVVSAMSLTSVRESSDQVERSHGVIADARQIAKLIVDLETSHRGYLITGSDEFLRTHGEASTRLGQELGGLRQLALGNWPQSERVNLLEGLLADWQAEVGEPGIAMRRRIGAAASSGGEARRRAMAEVGLLLEARKGLRYEDKPH